MDGLLKLFVSQILDSKNAGEVMVVINYTTSGILTMPKPLTVWITSNCEKFLEMGIPDHLTCLLINLYSGQEAIVRFVHGITDRFQIGKGVHQDCILSPCLFNFYAEYIMRNAGLDEAWAGNKIVRRNTNKLRYADPTLIRKQRTKEPLDESETEGLKLA